MILELLIRAFNWFYFATFGFEEHLVAKLKLETDERHRANQRLYAETADSLKEA